MALIRWMRGNELANEVQRMQREMDRIWRSLEPEARFGWEGALYPPINLFATPERFVLEAELPGYRQDAIELTMTNDTLTLRGQSGEELPEGGSYHRRERRRGAFSRSLQLPDPVDAEKVKASFVGGVLRVELPKVEAAKPRQIRVAG